MTITTSLNITIMNRPLTEILLITAIICLIGGIIIILGAGAFYSILSWQFFKIMQTMGIIIFLLGIVIFLIVGALQKMFNENLDN